jgi:hypothetical protein
MRQEQLVNYKTLPSILFGKCYKQVPGLSAPADFENLCSYLALSEILKFKELHTTTLEKIRKYYFEKTF